DGGGEAAGEAGETVFRGGELGAEEGHGGLGEGEVRLGLGDVDPRHKPGVEPPLREIDGAALGRDVAVGHGDALLQGAVVDVVQGDLGEEGDEGVAVVLLAGGEVRVGGFDGAADAAEEVDL